MKVRTRNANVYAEMATRSMDVNMYQCLNLLFHFLPCSEAQMHILRLTGYISIMSPNL